jgi:hypothetical protein
VTVVQPDAAEALPAHTSAAAKTAKAIGARPTEST